MKALLLAALLTGCAAQRVPVEPTVRTITVQVPVPVPCAALERVGPSPDYPDSDSALAAAESVFRGVQLLRAGRVLRIAREAAMEAAMAACASPG